MTCDTLIPFSFGSFENYTEFFTVTLIGLLVIISPGPDFAIVTKTSIAKGRADGVGSAIGIAVANLCHVMLNLLGIGVIIASSTFIFTIMKILGAAYLLYIGYKGLRAKPGFTESSLCSEIEKNKLNHTIPESQSRAFSDSFTSSSSRSFFGIKGFYSGFLTSILNPKCFIFFLSFFSVLLSPETPFITQMLYGTWISTMALIWFVLVAIFFTHPFISEKLKRSKHWIERIAGGALLILGLHLLSTEANI